MKKNLSKNKKEANKGITLIALVITIIVLLILAGVSIATLTGENGILTQAQTSKERTEIAEAKEQAKLDIMAWRAEKIANGEDETLDDATVKTIIAGKEYVDTLADDSFTTKEGHTILYKDLYTTQTQTPTPPVGGDIAEVGKKVTGSNKPYTKNGTAIIPVGFAIVPGLDDVSEGLVISDVANDTTDVGNQFVWVPVSKANFATEFVREHFGTEDQKWWKGTFVTDGLSANNMYEPKSDGLTVDKNASSSVQEVQKMYKSVRDNGGFYIGRYEAGIEGVESTSSSQSGIRGNVVSKKGANVYNNIGWNNTGNYDTTVETGGAVEVARGFAGEHNYETVTSTLVYGVQWDAVMRWISKDDELKGYLTDSTPVGNYYDDDSTNDPAKTGVVKEYQLKNIYNMAGNVHEWTMESYNTGSIVCRGGSYNRTRTHYPVSYRASSNYPSDITNFIGFRVALYVDV